MYAYRNGYFISHAEFIESCYKGVQYENNDCQAYQLEPNLFKIKSPFKKMKSTSKKRKKSISDLHCSGALENNTMTEVNYVRETSTKLLTELKSLEASYESNDEAVKAAESIYESTKDCNLLLGISGGNNENYPLIATIHNEKYLIPANCKFYCDDVKNISKHLSCDNTYDVILLDPPWWNKYIRRKKAKTEHGYQMMYTNDLGEIPINKLLSEKGLVVIWCTNSQQHMQNLVNGVFQKWDVKFFAKWYWMKVTLSGEPVCPFSYPPGKQPFEQVLFATKHPESYEKLAALDKTVFASIPSALHSHKPPLLGLLEPFISEDAKCLELFARYLLPNWTSFGYEALKFQHLSLYQPKE